MLLNLRFFTYALAFAVASSATNAASAAVNLTASFIEPTATVTVNDPIEIWLRISAQPDSDPFYYDPTQSPAFQIPSQFLPTDGLTGNGNETKPFDTYDELSRTTVGRCGPAVSCFALPGMYAAQSVWLYDTAGLTIAPGESKDVLLDVYEPVIGSVVPGTYVLEGAGVGLTAYGQSSDGTRLAANVIFGFACAEGSACNFTRTVMPVPEPGTYSLMLIGLIAAMTMRRVKSSNA